MSADSGEQVGKEMTRTVTAFFPSNDENKPHGVRVDGDRYTTFNDTNVEEIEEGATIRFRYQQNGEHRNIVEDSVEVIEDTPGTENEVYGSTDRPVPESPRDRSIRNNVALKQARELCQPLVHEDMDEDRFNEVVDLVAEIAKTFEETLDNLNRQVGQGET